MNDIKGGTVIVIGIVALIVGFLICLVAMPKQIEGDKMFSQADMDQALAGKDNEINTLRGLIEKQNDTETEEEIEEIDESKITGYLIDELFLNSTFADNFSDREIDLFDGEVEFDNDDYNAKEILMLTNLNVAINGEDFEENSYLEILKDGILYEFIIEQKLDTSLIGIDGETLVINFLGKNVEISNWTDDEITIFRGTEMFVDESEIVDFEDYKIVLISVTDDSVYLSVENSEGNLENKIIDEGKTRTINGLKIKVDDVFASETKSFAELVVGTNIETEVANGEEYEEDSIWNWVIDADTNTIGLILSEDFKELDDREGYNILDVEESLCLPNDYVCIKYNGLSEEDELEYSFELDDGIVIVEGDLVGLNDYEELFINTSNGYIFEDDDVANNGLRITEDIYFGDSDKILTVIDGVIDTNTGIKFSCNSTDLFKLEVDGKDISNKEDNYRSIYGTIVYSPEDNLEDNEVKISIPEEQLEGSISIKQGNFNETEVEDSEEEPTI